MTNILLADTYIKCLKHDVQYPRGAVCPKCSRIKKYMYIVVRTDMPPIHQLVQASHSAIEAGSLAQNVQGVHLVVLGVKNKVELCKVSTLLTTEQIEHKMFSEGYKDIGYTSLTTLPIPKLSEGILCSLSLLAL